MSSIWRTFVIISALFGAVVGCSSSTSSGDGDDSSEEGGRDGGGDDTSSGDGDGDGDGDDSSSAGDDGTTVSTEDDTEPVGDDLTLLFNPMYSAYDGVHEYKLPAIVQGVSGIKWSANPADAVDMAPDSKTGGILITTRKPVTVQIIARAGALSGSAELHITDATPDDWEVGEMRYNNEIEFPDAPDSMFMRVDGGFIGSDGEMFTSVDGGFVDSDGGMYTFTEGGLIGPDGMAIDAGAGFELPNNLSCRNCHSSLATALDVEHTPQQTGGYSDDELISIFTMGMKPEGAGFHTPFPESIYTRFHPWDATDEEKKGIVVYLRSLEPKTQGPLDFMGLGEAFGR